MLDTRFVACVVDGKLRQGRQRVTLHVPPLDDDGGDRLLAIAIDEARMGREGLDELQAAIGRVMEGA